MTFGMFLCRYCIFTLQESPKFLVAVGRDEEAIESLTYIAKRNGKQISLTTEKLLACGHTNRMNNKASIWRTFMNTFSHFSL